MTRWPTVAAGVLVSCAITLLSGCASAGARHGTLAPSAGIGTASTIEARDQALSAALARLAFFPSAEAHKAVAREYRRLGLLEQAFDQFGGAVRLDPRDAEAYDARARIWRDWGFPERGMGDAARAAYLAADSAAAHNTWGTLLAASGWLASAQRQFDLALALDPKATYAMTNSCYVAFAAGQISRAPADCRRAVEGIEIGCHGERKSPEPGRRRPVRGGETSVPGARGSHDRALQHGSRLSCRGQVSTGGSGIRCGERRAPAREPRARAGRTGANDGGYTAADAGSRH